MIETIVALVLSSVVIILVSTTFLVQNQYFSAQTLYAGAHDDARAATERIAGELRSSMEDGFVIAGNRTLTIRSPIVVAATCNRLSNDVDVHIEGGLAALDTDEVAGVAMRDASTGVWDYRTTTWSTLNGGGALAAGRCALNGADTSWAAAEFHTIRQLQTLFGSAPDPGVALMLYRETTFKIQGSVLEPGTLGLFRGIYGQSLVEFATGMDTTAQFQYRTGGSTYADTITGSAIGDIDAVRIVADARKRAQTGGRADITYGWSVNVALRNLY